MEPTEATSTRGSRQPPAHSPGGFVDAVAGVLEGIDADGWLHAVDLESGAEVEYHGDEPVVLASVFKIPVLVELFRRFGDGRLDPAERIDVPVEGRSEGPTGLSVMADPIELSLRDLAYWMMSVSDNAATDILVNLLGPSTINATLEELGIVGTRVDGTCADLFLTVAEDVPEAERESDTAALRACRAIDPVRTLHAGTARGITRLLSAIWADEAAEPAMCAEMRRILGMQAWPHRLRTGFPETDTTVSAKTGTLPLWRNEVGVVEDGRGGRYAVAVFLRTSALGFRNPRADAAIGTLGRLAVDRFRPQERRRDVTVHAAPAHGGRGDVAQRIQERARDVGAQIWLHVQDIDGGDSVGIGASKPVATASVFKIPVAVELARQAATGEIDLTERVTITRDDHVPSPVGLACHRDQARLSYRDVALLMMVISDNLATDLILGRVGKVRVNALLAELGLSDTAVPQTCGELLDSIGEDLGYSYADDESELAGVPVDRLNALRALTPERTCRTTPADIARLLAMVWRDEAAPGEACEMVRAWMGHQIWPHRLTSGFPDDRITVSGKTGTLPLIRNEAGVVEYPDSGRYAVGVFTKTADPAPKAPRVDALIGWAAAEAIAHLRGEGSR